MPALNESCRPLKGGFLCLSIIMFVFIISCTDEVSVDKNNEQAENHDNKDGYETDDLGGFNSMLNDLGSGFIMSDMGDFHFDMSNDSDIGSSEPPSFLESCESRNGEVFEFEGIEYCLLKQYESCPDDFLHEIDRGLPENRNFVICVDQNLDNGLEVYEHLNETCSNSPDKQTTCEERGSFCSEVTGIDRYDSSSESCEQTNTNLCLFITDEENGTSCWTKKLEDGSLEVYVGFDILPPPWVQGSQDSMACTLCDI